MLVRGNPVEYVRDIPVDVLEDLESKAAVRGVVKVADHHGASRFDEGEEVGEDLEHHVWAEHVKEVVGHDHVVLPGPLHVQDVVVDDLYRGAKVRPFNLALQEADHGL